MKLRSILSALLLTAGIAAAPSAKSAIIMSIQQVGSDVLATATGDADITGFSISFMPSVPPQVIPFGAVLLFGPSTASNTYDLYEAVLAGPTSFGGGSNTAAASASGSALGIQGLGGFLALPSGYVSGSALSSTMTFTSTTLAGLGLTTGTYTWTWGSGANADSLTLYIGVPVPSAVPVPASLLLLATGVAAATTLRRRKTS